ncbi:hypothetical protein [Pseudobdellovibrio exovorus]|uniref:Uncharacterized protein n=1 Tax=Pseudobdellovibrio exovorus JSS TaxID=1184267 RepID=M4VA53_9BACT|nr:hypothetical protein [Pseudobdellovibrio exovorus]AGH96083.1 hypothetical protein A11Q_1867 [Pseudobdellovibrio exovorus JSS]
MEIISINRTLPVKKEHKGGLHAKVRELQNQGYTEKFSAGSDHLTCRAGNIKVYPHDIIFEDVFRFEDQSSAHVSTVYAISYPDLNLKGLYIESATDVLNFK